MPLTLDRIVNVAGPSLDSAFTASEKLNDNADALEAAVDAAVPKALFDAHTILAATSDNTPAALTVAEQTLVGRITSGNIAALTAAQIRTLLNVEDGAAADLSAAEILALLLTVDGSGSGLDADLLDGLSSAAFATAAQGATADLVSTRYIGQNLQTGTTYTLVLGDAGKIVEMNNASAIALTIPDNGSVAFPVDTRIDIVQYGAGQVTVGITTDTLRGNTKTPGQYKMVSLWKRASTEWVIIGGSA